MPYLAIEKNGDEYIFQNKPVRLSTGWCSFELSAIKIPRKSILRLTGIRLTWASDPIELVERYKSKSDDFAERICAMAGCFVDELYFKTRKRKIMQARQFVLAYRKVYLGLTLRESGLDFEMDHASVIHSIRTIQNLYKTDRVYREQFKYIFKEFPDLLTYVIGDKS